MSDASGVTLETNGKTHLSGAKILGWIAGALLSIVVWVFLDVNARVRDLEKNDSSNQSSISLLKGLRPEDRALIESIAEASRADSDRLRRLEINVARILAKLDIEEAH